MPPQQKQRARSRYFPEEIIEQIMLNLPVKSLLRFSTVSKSWNSIISETKFTRKHKNRAALLRRHTIVINAVDATNFSCFSTISPDLPISDLSSAGDACFRTISSDQPTAFGIGKFRHKTRLRALCDELWCVEAEKSLYLWNPCLRSYRKLPDPLFPCTATTWLGDFTYGLGYDCVGDDYKILKIGKGSERRPNDCELFSLKRNCWRMLESRFPSAWFQDRCEFLHGNFHWIGYSESAAPIAIAHYNLSTEKYGLMQPELNRCGFLGDDEDAQVVVVRGMLCVCVNLRCVGKLRMWVMEEYGVEKSWTKKFDVKYDDSFPYMRKDLEFPARVKPLHFNDENDVVIMAYDIDEGLCEVVLYENKAGRKRKQRRKYVRNVEPTRIVSCVPGWLVIYDAFLYVESLISPVVAAG